MKEIRYPFVILYVVWEIYKGPCFHFWKPRVQIVHSKIPPRLFGFSQPICTMFAYTYYIDCT